MGKARRPRRGLGKMADQMDQRQQAELQQFVQQAQQSAQTHAIMDKFTDMCFKKCIARPGTSMSSYEGECVANCMKRYIESKKFIVERFQQTQQAGAPPPTPSGGGLFG